MKRNVRRMTAFLLAVFLVVSGVSATGATVRFDRIVYETVSVETVTDLQKEIETLCKDAANADQVLELFDRLLQLYEQAETMGAYAMVMYSMNVKNTAWARQYARQRSDYATISNSVITAARAVMVSPCAKQALSAWDSTTLSRARATRGYTDLQMDLIQQENRLISEYYSEMASVTGVKIMELGRIYISMLDTRNKLAGSFGYSDYGEYAYHAVYGRDYTPAQSLDLAQQVKKTVCPLYAELVGELPSYAQELYDGMETLTGEKLVKAVMEAAPDVLEEADQCLTELWSKGYCSVDKDSNKMNASFTVLLPSVESPYLFLAAAGTPFDLTTLTHELGHSCFFSAYPVSAWYGGAVIDVAEIHSTAMQLLFMDAYDGMLGEKLGGMMEDYTLLQTLFCLVSGCFYDEFQQRAYALEDPCYNDLEEIYNTLLKEYRLEPGMMVHWTELSHNFDQPFYYISYAVASAGGLELWLDSLTDREAGKTAYRTLIANSFNSTQAQALSACGLSDPMRADSIRQLTGRLKAQLCYHCQFTDIDGHWGAEYVSRLYDSGAISGVGQYTFAPDGKMTRAMFVTVLGRLMGEAGQTDTLTYTDIDKNAYYAPYLSWATETGLITGSGGYFRPSDTISRQEMAVILMRLFEEKNTPLPEQESGFADTDSIAVWAQSAASSLAAMNILQGKGENRFDPRGVLTRAEGAAVLYRAMAYLEQAA